MSEVPNLRPIRERQLLSQVGLAAIAEIPPTSISHFEAGTRDPSLPTLRKLADALGCSADELMGRQKPDHVVAERNMLARRMAMIARLAAVPDVANVKVA